MRVVALLIAILVTTFAGGQGTDSSNQQKSFRHKKNFKYYFSRDTSIDKGKSTRLDFQLDFRNSFIRDFPIDIYGGNIGIIIHRKFRIGAGYYVFSQRFSNRLLGLRPATGIPYTDRNGRPIPVTKLTSRQPYIPSSQNLTVNYGCINFTYMFYTSRLIDLYVPIEIGYGTFSEKLVDPSGYDFITLPRAPIPSAGYFWPGQIGVMAITKIHRWAYFLSALGYRKTLNQKFTSESAFTNFESQFESYYYRLGLQIQIGSIWRDLHKKKK